MVGDDAEAHVVLVVRAVALARELDRPVEHRTHLVGLVHVVDALLDERDALQAHAGVDVLVGSSPTMSKSYFERTFVDRVLHEDEVPDLDVAVVVGGGAAVDAVRRSAVEEDLGAGAGRARQAGAPVVRVLAEPLDALLGEAGDALPQLERLVVLFVDGDPEVLRVEAEPAVGLGGRQQIPRVADRALLEVVAERPVAEHLEERAVAGRLADLFDVVRADALLHVGGARVRRGHVAAQVRDERHHAGDREQQRRVVGDERCGRHDGVAVLLEVVEVALRRSRRSSCGVLAVRARSLPARRGATAGGWVSR